LVGPGDTTATQEVKAREAASGRMTDGFMGWKGRSFGTYPTEIGGMAMGRWRGNAF
jgi:hypothetical protein